MKPQGQFSSYKTPNQHGWGNYLDGFEEDSATNQKLTSNSSRDED